MPPETQPAPIERYERAVVTATGHLTEHLSKLRASPLGAVPRAADLNTLREAGEALEVARTELVALLRNGVSEQVERGRLEVVHPHTWAEIAKHLGTTRQGAQRRYEPAVQELAPEDHFVTRVQRSRRLPAPALPTSDMSDADVPASLQPSPAASPPPGAAE